MPQADEIGSAYADAWETWAAEEADAWEAAVADGLDDALPSQPAL